MSEPRSDREWADFYADERDIYDAFVQKLRVLVETLLDEAEVNHAWVISYSNAPGFVEDELARERRAGHPIEKPLESNVRVAGVTIGVHNDVPVDELGDLIRREFAVVAQSSDPREARHAKPITYGYVHYLVSLDERRLELTEWARFAGLKARIEIKTLLQDVWENVDLDLPFYDADSYPAEVRDLLIRAAAGLAAVDELLTDADEAMRRLYAGYAAAIEAGELQIGINGVSLHAYVLTSELVGSLTDLGVDVGFQPYPEYEPGWQSIEPGILWLLRRDDVHTLAELEEFLKQATPRARKTLEELQRLLSDGEFNPWATPDTIVEWLWLILRRADAATIAMMRYRDELERALNTLIGNPVAADEPQET
ncbi:MAG TPA: hypothetical protein VM049_04590 [Gaiellaceae bacterium]|nr:hypothetical protein [Gaiellaceae bacterium]